MTSVQKIVHGALFLRPGKDALLLDESRPEIRLRFALMTLGEERLFFPHVLLDDWGNEISGLKMYQWIHQNGNQFPRAEIFGEDHRGRETQYFLREIDYHEPLRCYAVPGPGLQAVRLSRFFLPDNQLEAPVRIEVPENQPYTLRHAQASWWRVNPTTMHQFGYKAGPEGAA